MLDLNRRSTCGAIQKPSPQVPLMWQLRLYSRVREERREQHDDERRDYGTLTVPTHARMDCAVVLERAG